MQRQISWFIVVFIERKKKDRKIKVLETSIGAKMRLKVASFEISHSAKSPEMKIPRLLGIGIWRYLSQFMFMLLLS